MIRAASFATPRERTAAALGAALILLAMVVALVLGLRVRIEPRLLTEPLTVLGLEVKKPEEKPRAPLKRSAAKAPKGAPSPRNLRNKATQVVAPPVPALVVPPPIIAAPRAGLGSAASNGASDLPGPGQGAGGIGDGLGGGGDGGDGDGDGLAGLTPPRQIRGRLHFSDMPEAMVDAGQDGTVAVRYYVEVDGHVRGCTVTASSGNAELDRITCSLIERRFRFRPSRDADGRPVRSAIVETHYWTVEREPEAPER